MWQLLSDLWDSICSIFEPSPPGTVVAPCGKTLHNIPGRASTPAFQHNPDGSIVATPVGGPIEVGHGGAPGELFRAQQYELKLADGTTIPAFTSSTRVDPTTGNLVP